MDYIFGQSTWPLLLGTLLTALEFFFYLMFSSLNSQLTWPLGKENAGFPQSCLALDFMDDIHDQLLQNKIKFFLVFVFFFTFFILGGTYRRRLIKKQLPSSRLSSSTFKQGHISGPSNIALGCSQPSVPTREVCRCQTKNRNEKSHSLGKKYDNKSSEHSTDKISFKHSGCAIGEEWVENGIQWKIGSNGELLCQDIVRQADSPSAFEHPERVTKPEVYAKKWLTVEQHDAALASHILVRQETWKERFRRAKAKLEFSRPECQSFTNWVRYFTDRMPDYKFGLSGNRYIDLVYFKEDPIPTLTDEAEDKMASQPTDTSHSPSSSPSLSSVEAQNPLHPPASSTSTSSFHLPATDSPTLQLATPSEAGAPSDAAPRVITESEGETLQPTISPILFSLDTPLFTSNTTPTASTSAIQSTTVLDPLTADLLPTPSGATSPSQPIFNLNTITSAIESAATDNQSAADQSTPSKRHSKQRKRTKRFAPSHAASSDGTSAPAVHDPLATELDALSTSGIAGPFQPIPSGFSTSAAEPTLIDTFAAGHDAPQFPSTSSSAAGPIHPTFDLSVSTSTAEVATVDDTLAPGYEESEFLSTLSGPSQPTFDSNADTSPGEFTTVDDILTAGHKGFQFLSTLLGPPQPTFNSSASTSTGAEFTTVDDAVAAGYETLQFLSTLSCPADPFQPVFNFGAGTFATEFTAVDNAVASGYEASQYISSFSGPSQPTFDLGAGTFATESATVDNTWDTGYEAPELLPALSGPSQPIFGLGAGASAADELAAELDDELTAELQALLSSSAPSGSTDQFAPSKNGSRRRRRAKASSRQMLANKSSSYPSIQREPNLTAASFRSGSDSQPSMVAFNPLSPGDRTINVSDAPAMGSYPFSFKFNGSASAGNVNVPRPSASVPGTIGSTPSSFNDAGTSNVSGGAMISANKQAEATLSTQMPQLIFDLGVTGGQLTSMDTTTYEDSGPDLGMDAGSSAVDTMEPSSSSLFNALG